MDVFVIRIVKILDIRTKHNPDHGKISFCTLYSKGYIFTHVAQFMNRGSVAHRVYNFFNATTVAQSRNEKT